MEGDIFVSSNSNKTVPKQEKNNFFLNSEDNLLESVTPDTSRRLNDYDFNILKEEAYKDVTDELLKLEYKISKSEEELKLIQAQIDASLEIGDTELMGTLIARKQILQTDINNLIEIYNDKSLSAKISGGISGILKKQFGTKIRNLKNNLEEFAESISSYLPQKFAKAFEIKKSLAKLENINKSVDELMTLQIPYGEAYDKYDQLSKYILKANSIQSEISKHIR